MGGIINLRRACAARVMELGEKVCMCVSVTTFSATTRNKLAKSNTNGWLDFEFGNFTEFKKIMICKPSQQANVPITFRLPQLHSAFLHQWKHRNLQQRVILSLVKPKLLSTST